MRKIPFAGIELTSQRVRGLRGTSELPGRPVVQFINCFLAYDTRSELGMYILKITTCRLCNSFRAIVKTSIVVVVFTLKAVPVSTQYFLTSVLVQLTRTPSVVTG